MVSQKRSRVVNMSDFSTKDECFLAFRKKGKENRLERIDSTLQTYSVFKYDLVTISNRSLDVLEIEYDNKDSDEIDSDEIPKNNILI
ncbi:MAG: hypothetical protein ABSF81_05890 [Bacteroidales bacterium]